ncbi:dual specificity protein phosphatase, putative, partial [Bodo saltans]
MSFLPNISVVETHELFNWFNNMFPILPIEFRLPTSALRPKHQLRNTVALDIELDSQVDPVSLRSALEVLCAAHRRSVGERIAVVLCHGESTLNVVLNLLSSQPQLVLPGISELRVVDFGRFCEAYGHCTGVFDDSFHREDASTTDDGQCRDQSSRQHRRTQVYYASEVIPQLLYLGDFENGQSKAQLQALQITHVIDATNVMSSKQSAKEIGINYLAVNVEDRPDANIAQFFDSVIDFVKVALH